jgi:TRAP transporter 4TM/12TM fusion protein
MSDPSLEQVNSDFTSAEEITEKFTPTGASLTNFWSMSVAVIGFAWSFWQLWIASPLPFIVKAGIFVDMPARGLHLAFGLALCFLIFGARKSYERTSVPWFDVFFVLIAVFCASYLWLGYGGIVERNGILLKISFLGFTIPFEAILSFTGILLLLEATRRSIGWPLVIICSIFLAYSMLGQYMPDIISHKGVSLQRLIGYQWLTGEAIFGIPIDVSVSFVFLFVLFGALMDRAGAGKFFLDLSFAMVGKYRGGPAKAAVLASGMTGMVSGSSIANTVTTGSFTIPVMKRTGYPAVKAGAIEVAASTNGQIMPPIMGAAAFIIAEFIGISYYDVIVHAALPAFIAYCGLFYIVHLEACKLGLRGLSKTDIPIFFKVFFSGLHYLIPIVVLVYLLLVPRWSPASSVFYSIILMMLTIIIQRVVQARAGGFSIWNGVWKGFKIVADALVGGAKNMVAVTAATGAAGIIVGVVSSTGLNNAMLEIVEAISQGNIYILLILTAVVCLILGMGLPTTANYIVVASLMAGVLVELGDAAGLDLPLIAVHLYVFYFGLMADSTPPVCLAAFAASAISGADPMKTGVQSFLYDIRTSILPLVFIFNPELLLVGVDSLWHALVIFIVSLIAILCFSSLTQHYMFVKNKLYESILLILIIVGLFRPDFILDQFSPAYVSLELDKVISGETSLPPDRTVRLHIIRNTDYGDRYKLFRLRSPIKGDSRPLSKVWAMELAKEKDGRYSVANLGFMGMAEKSNVVSGDYVTSIDVEQIDRLPKELVYPVALLLLVFVIIGQRRRSQLGTC